MVGRGGRLAAVAIAAQVGATTVKRSASAGATLCQVRWFCGWPCSRSSGGPLPPTAVRMRTSPVSMSCSREAREQALARPRSMTAAAIALPISCVLAVPPRSRRARALGEHGLDRAHDGGRGVLVAEMVQHHGAGPDLADRVGDARPAMSGAEPCTGSNIDGIVALRVEVGRGRDADRAGAGRAEVGEDVAEEVGADHHVEPVRDAGRNGRSGCRCGTGRC